jgi:hypothetical protein
MGDESSFVDPLFLMGAPVLIIATSTGFGRRRRRGKSAEGRRAAADRDPGLARPARLRALADLRPTRRPRHCDTACFQPIAAAAFAA